MSKHDDDFWGGQAEWDERGTSLPSTPSAEHGSLGESDPVGHDEWADTALSSHGAQRPLDRLRSRWSSMLSAGANPTREHGIVRPAAARARRNDTVGHGIDSTMFDDLDDDVVDAEIDGAAAAVRPSRRDDHRRDVAQSGQLHDRPWTDEAWTDERWDAEFEPAPVTAERAARRGPGIDPLLARIGVVAVATALLIPLMLNNGSDATDTLLASTASAPTPSAVSDEGPPVAPTLFPADSAPSHDGGPAASTSASSAPLDISDLPRAIPVNPPAASAPNAEADAAIEDIEETATTSTESLQDGTAAAEISDADSTGSGSIDDVARADAPAKRVEPVCAIDYVVVDGDFWIRIADGAGVELDELLEANRATVQTPLFAGRTICLPAGSSTPPPPVVTTTAPPTVPLVLGGDHTVPLLVLQGLHDAGALAEPPGLLQIDAHADLLVMDDGFRGREINHATFARVALEDGLVDPKRTVQLGLRGSQYTPDTNELVRTLGGVQIYQHEFDAMGQAAAIATIVETLGPGPVYITLDIDGLDPTCAPGTGHPEPGGLTVREMQAVFRALRGVDVIGCDVCEVSPPHDPEGMTALTAAHLMFEMLCLAAEAVAKRKGR